MLRSSRGFAFIYALMGIAIISIAFYSISSYVNVHSKRTYEDLNIAQGRMILHSLTDYTLMAVKQRYCLTESWLPEKIGCDLNHPRSVDRLLMSPDSERYLINYLKSQRIAVPSNIHLDEITTVVDVGALLADHPLSEMVAPLRASGLVSFISFKLTRDHNSKLATSGRETFVHLEVELQNSRGTPAIYAGNPMMMSSNLAVFPRELGSFALVLANDLHMDLPYSPVAMGDFNIHKFASQTAVAGYAGLVFASPVLVNGNIYLSPPSDGASTGYAAVTFADKVYTGGGNLYRTGDVLYAPKSAGRTGDQLWTDVKEFGGFQRGIEIEPGRDRGLDILSGRVSGRVDLTLVQQCLSMIQVKSELKWTASSSLQAKYIDGNLNSGLRYRVGFNTPRDYPNPLISVPTKYMTPGGGQGVYSPPRSQGSRSSQGVALSATLMIRSMPPLAPLTIPINLELDSRFTYTYTPPVNQARLDQISGLTNNILGRLRDPTLIPGDRDSLNAQLNSLRSEARTLSDVVNTRSTITIDLRSVPTQPIYADVQVTMRGQMVDFNAQPTTFDLRLEGYDLSCRPELSQCRETLFPVNSAINPVYLTGYQRFGFLNGLGSAIRPVGLADTPGIAGNKAMIDDATDFARLEDQCTYKGQSAFGGAAWDSTDDSKFSEGAAIYWNFTALQRGTPQPDLDFNGTNAFSSTGSPGGTAAFQVKSIVPNCRIRSSANFVTGFYNCDYLTIDARSTPLKIVGTFIVNKGLTVDPSAYQAGIWWSSIYNSMATPELRRAGILQATTPGYNCNNPNTPLWHPYASMTDSNDFYSCNVGSLRASATPFQWTSVDPDCGISSAAGTDAVYVCKNQQTRYQVFELYRESRL